MADEPQGAIHGEHPFLTPLELREPARRLRGRLVAPVTLWTAGPPGGRTGLTMSSVLVEEGDPPSVLGLLGDTTDLWYAIEETGAFVVHVLEEDHWELAERFAGLRPSPGGPFRGLTVDDSRWGPLLRDLESRALCRLLSSHEVGHHLLVRGAIEEIELHDLIRPLTYYRGRFRSLRPEED